MLEALKLVKLSIKQTIKNISLQDVQNYYNNYMTSNGAKVVVVGDIKQEEILPKLSFLNKLPNKKIVLSKPATHPTIDKTKVYLVDVPKAAQSEFRIGYATGLKYDATGEYYKANLANYPLGSSPNGRLFLNLREADKERQKLVHNHPLVVPRREPAGFAEQVLR